MTSRSRGYSDLALVLEPQHERLVVEARGR